jgi:hypothetical protein
MAGQPSSLFENAQVATAPGNTASLDPKITNDWYGSYVHYQQ